ncbi:MAG: hypothetical protein CMJ70_16590 [Planctomycetaceae bacterium]|nr:hypothetical protein [Planctomycetaceae bacterium]HAA71691.1 DUF1501 domain-containing protein [Planctomycetaceae bacterium]|tara:strand:+ start:3776 stop:5215 length:1440 start_codon:yes stop_codon:yes gene_type:complete
MFTISDRQVPTASQGYSRRDFLRIGSLAPGGMTLASLLENKASAATKGFLRDKSVVLLFVQGGPPQVETFDPKMNAPLNIRSGTGEVPTSLPGVTFGGTFPQLGRRAEKLAIVRSFHSGDGSHNQLPILSGNCPTAASMGSQFARLAGTNHPVTAVPTHSVIMPEQIQPDLQLGEPTGPFTYNYIRKHYPTAGKLGGAYEGLFLTGGKGLAESLTLSLSRERFDDRRSLLNQLDQFKRRVDSTGALDGATGAEQQAIDVLLQGIADAFNLSKEHPETIAKYDTSPLFRMQDWHQGGVHYHGKRNQSRITNLLGKQMLLARRLCEAGCGFVTVSDACWDFHNDGNNPPSKEAMMVLGHQLDHAVAAFLDDLEERGLSDKILLVVTGEMGRTPKKKENGGTDHWARLTPLLIAGGGLRMGQVIGKTDRLGGEATTPLYGPSHLRGTIMQTLFDPAETRLIDGLPRDLFNSITATPAIAELS